MASEAMEDLCVPCQQPVGESDRSLECDLCDRWEHVTCVRQCDRLSEVYAALVGCRTKALMYVCSAYRRKGSVAKRLLQHELERARADDERLASMRRLAECDSTISSLRADKQQLIERTTALQGEVGRLSEQLTKVTVVPESRVDGVEGDGSPELEPTSEYLSDSDESIPSVVSPVQPLQGQLDRWNDTHRRSRRVNPHFPGFRALCTWLEKFSGRSGDNDFEVWVEDFKEATADCEWDDQLRAK